MSDPSPRVHRPYAHDRSGGLRGTALWSAIACAGCLGYAVWLAAGQDAQSGALAEYLRIVVLVLAVPLVVQLAILRFLSGELRSRAYEIRSEGLRYSALWRHPIELSWLDIEEIAAGRLGDVSMVKIVADSSGRVRRINLPIKPSGPAAAVLEFLSALYDTPAARAFDDTAREMMELYRRGKQHASDQGSASVRRGYQALAAGSFRDARGHFRRERSTSGRVFEEESRVERILERLRRPGRTPRIG
jgi:hypothetical protein